jgi:5,10-methylenetetrahydromethanopterin reductase
MKFGLRLIQWLGTPERLVELAVLAERAGFDQVWFPHDPFMLNTWTLSSAVAARTDRITVASIGTNPYTTDPSEIATYLATLDLLSGGRATIGIGLHTDAMVGWTGHDAGDRIDRTRIAVDVVRRLLRGETVAGPIGPYTWTDECFLRFEPLRSDVPIYVAAYDRAYLELSGEIGDGSLPMITPPESATAMAGPILDGARRAGRDPGGIDIAGCAWLSISSERAAAAEILRPMIAYFGPYLEEHALAEVGLSREELAPLKTLVDSGQLAEASAAVTEPMLQLAIVGTPSEVTARIERLAEAGITQVNLGGPLGPDPAEAIRLVGEQVIPNFRDSA